MKRHGLTLIELLIATSITMIMMGAFVTLMGNMTNNVADSRAVIEISERLRSARNRLQKDLESVTARMVPPLDPASNLGYFEYTEGTTSFDASGYQIPIVGQTAKLTWQAPTNPMLLGDIDDILMFTIHGRGEMFSGNIGGTTFQAADAEVAWFLQPQIDPLIPTQQRTIMTANGPLPLYSLYRRVLLVDPALMSSAAVTAVMPTAPPLPNVLQTYIPTSTNAAGLTIPAGSTLDLSMYTDHALSGSAGQNVILGNTLASLGRHENRFGHLDPMNGAVVPTIFNSPQPVNMIFPGPASGTVSPRYGEDVILTDVLAFDVQAFDPCAPLMNPPVTNPPVNTGAMEPSNPGWGYSSGYTVAGMGAFVDLGWAFRLGYNASVLGYPSPWFGGNPSGNIVPYPPIYNAGNPLTSGPPTQAFPATTAALAYDSWTTAYEAFGPATNGLDDPDTSAPSGDGIVDNESERRTTPPFSKPLRAIRVTLRVYEPASQQVRQVTVVQDFLPQ